MTFSLFKNKNINTKKTPYNLFIEIDKLNTLKNAEYNLVMTIEKSEPLLLKFRNSKPEIRYTKPEDFSTTLFLKFISDKDQTTIALLVKPNPLFFLLYIIVAVLSLAMIISSRSAESLFGILIITIFVFAWDCYSRLSISRRVNIILKKVKY
jgi:hypothetical protein